MDVFHVKLYMTSTKRPWIFNNDIAIIISISDISPSLFYKYTFKNCVIRYEFK